MTPNKEISGTAIAVSALLPVYAVSEPPVFYKYKNTEQ